MLKKYLTLFTVCVINVHINIHNYVFMIFQLIFSNKCGT